MSFAAAWLIMMIIAIAIVTVRTEKITCDPRWAGQSARHRGMWLGITIVFAVALLLPPVVIFIAAADGLLYLATGRG